MGRTEKATGQIPPTTRSETRRNGYKDSTLQPVFYDSTSEKELKPPEKPKRTKGEGEAATQTEKYKKNITKEKKMKQERYRIIKVKDELLFHLKMGNEEPTRRKRM